MAKGNDTRQTLTCLRCGHVWLSKTVPQACANKRCRSIYWNKPRKEREELSVFEEWNALHRKLKLFERKENSQKLRKAGFKRRLSHRSLPSDE